MTIVALGVATTKAQTVPMQNAKTAEDEKKLKENPEGWKVGGTGTITFSQVGLKNWAGGGNPSISIQGLVTPFADLKSGKHLWQNRLGLEYGIQAIGKQGKKADLGKFQKNSDRIELFSKYGYQITNNGKWYAGAYVDIKSQMTKTKNFNLSPAPVISKFASPMYVEAALGIDYIPNNKFSLFMSPLASKMTIVADDAIAATNLHGNDENPADGKIQNFRYEMGLAAIATYKQEVVKNVNILSTVKIYKDYLHTVDYKGDKANFMGDIDVDWQTTIGLKVTKFITANVFTHLIWDNDQATPTYNDNNVVTGTSAKVQFKDIIGVGFSYSMDKVYPKSAPAEM